MSRLRPLLVAVGWLVLVVAVDWGAGAAIQAADGEEEDVAAGPVEEAPEGQFERDPRADAPALADAPWAAAYYDELRSLEYEYSPYTVASLPDQAGRYITIEGGARTTYRPEGADGPEAVEVWFLGGSTAFGEGQRDLHTIPSELARQAEADGVVLDVRNYGRQGFTSWQELLVFEREAAREGPPDVVVFYDGVNEYNAALEDPGGQPSHLDRDATAAALEAAGEPLPGVLGGRPAAVWERYDEVSLLGKLRRQLADLLGDPAGATPSPPTTEADVRGAYLRMVDLADALAADLGVVPLFVWQPGGAPETHPYSRIAETLPPPVVDLSDLLTGLDEQIFIDGAHTNERGALIVAEALWPLVRPLVEEVSGG